MTLSNNKRAALSHGSSRTNPADVDDPIPGLFDRIQSLKEEATNILKTTIWPGKSAAVALEFLNTIKNTPNLRNIPERAAPFSPDLHKNVRQFIKVLEDVRGRLEIASLEYGAGKTGFSGSIKDAISWGANRSSKILQSCREDVEKVWTPLHATVIDPRCHSAEEDDVGPSSQVPQDIHPPPSHGAPGVKPQESPTGAGGRPAKQTGTTQNPAATPPPGEISTSSRIDKKEKGSVSPEVLSAAGKIFTAVDNVSGLIPIVGSYVGAAAKLGSAVVEMVQTMDGNEEIAKDLEKRVSKLSDVIGYFKEQSARTGGEHVTARINGLQ
ncbi:hypothetical protein FRC00_006060, partial [Tulasnella sp. 408]